MTPGGSGRAAGLLLAAVVTAAGLAGGCVTETKQESRQPVTAKTSQRGQRDEPARQADRGAGGQSPSLVRGAVGERPNELTDPCAGRLHDLSGLLLMYYALNKHLPDRLEELAPLADGEFTPACPTSGRPYVYAPGGLPSSTSGERSLILYDAVAAHGGLRWGIFVAPPREGQPPATWVILMSDEVFRGYVPQGNR